MVRLLNRNDTPMGQFLGGQLDRKRKLSHRNIHLDPAKILSEEQVNNLRALSVVRAHLAVQVSRIRALLAGKLLNKVKDLVVVARQVRKRVLANSLLKEIAGMETIANSAMKKEMMHRALWEEVSNQLPLQIHLAVLPAAAFLHRHPFQQALLELVLRLATPLVPRPVRLAPGPVPRHLLATLLHPPTHLLSLTTLPSNLDFLPQINLLSHRISPQHNSLRLVHLATAILLHSGEDPQQLHRLALGLPHSPSARRPPRTLPDLAAAAALLLLHLVEVAMLPRHRLAAPPTMPHLRHFQIKTNRLLEKCLSHLVQAATRIHRHLEVAPRHLRVRFRAHKALPLGQLIRHNPSELQPMQIHPHLVETHRRDLVPARMLIPLLSVGARRSAVLQALEEILSRTKVLEEILGRTKDLVETKATANNLVSSLPKVDVEMELTADTAMTQTPETTAVDLEEVATAALVVAQLVDLEAAATARLDLEAVVLEEEAASVALEDSDKTLLSVDLDDKYGLIKMPAIDQSKIVAYILAAIALSFLNC